NGDVNKWKKFVYAVLARSYNHLSNKSIYKPDSVIYYCDRALATADDDAMVKFQATPGLSADNNFYGPLRNNLGSGYAVRQSAYITNLMKGTNPVFSGVFDPRIWYMLRPSISGEFNGITLNGGIGSIPATANRPEGFWGQRHDSLVPPANDLRARYIFRNASPMPVLTACEVQFMKAEAALRKGDRTTALAAYRKGIELSFDMLQTYFSTNVPTDRLLTTAVRESFLANPQVVPTAANLTLSHIMLQKYIALYGYGALETWVDMRRYHYTDRDGSGNQVYRDFVVPSETSVPAIWPDNNGKLAYRVRYRYNSEYVWNIEELKRIGADALDWHTKEVWFSKP
ncbi:MAG TPA: SusD/RagB family nutrient-binding outer membrane lipoprotein, partial [Lacibacter sp.]|nr:SusD/RagB family nutrient-binding outer membrane lipoprotein [Lacibacter sp.]